MSSIQMRANVILPPRLEKLKFSEFSNVPNTISTPTTPLSPAPEPFHIRILDKSEEEAVVEHLRKTFFKDEPLNVDLKITENGYPQELEKYSVKTIGEGNSLVAITDSGKIVGVCLNGTIWKDSHEEDNVSDPKFSKVVRLLDAVEEKADTFGKFRDIDKYLCIKILSVDGSWRGKGIAKLLVEKTIEIGKEQGYKLIRVDCSSNFSARAMAKLGFESISELKYEDYKPDGEVVFRPAFPHTEVKAFVWRL